MATEQDVRQDPTGGAKSPNQDQRPRAPRQTVPESGTRVDAEPEGRDAERVLERAMTRVPPG